MKIEQNKKCLNDERPLNLFVTIDENYIPQFNVMLYSLLRNNKSETISVYLLHNSIDEKLIAPTRKMIGSQGTIRLLKIDEIGLKNAPTSVRYPKEMYYRIFAAKYLPEDLDRALYLDPDIIINKSLRSLYETPLGTSLFAAATHIRGAMHFFNELRLGIDKKAAYINSGVMLFNLPMLRTEQNYSDVFEYIDSHKGRLFLPDQDIISGLYGDKIKILDAVLYNMTERMFVFRKQPNVNSDLEFVRDNSVVIHYCGKNKPWKNSYKGRLGVFYEETISKMADDDSVPLEIKTMCVPRKRHI